MSITEQYQLEVKATFPNPSPEMAAYIEGFNHRETDAELDVQQARWMALSDDERDSCWAIARTFTGEA